MDSGLILLAAGPDNAFRAFSGDDEGDYRAAFAAFVAAWGPDSVWFDPEGRVVGSDGGVTLARWRARITCDSPAFALVVQVAGTPADVYLVDGAPTAERIVLELVGDAVSFALVELEPLAKGARDGSAPDEDLRAVRVIRGRGGRPRPPRARLGEDFCPRCLDQRLHLDSLFDALTPDGIRVCAACGTLDQLRRPA